MRILLVCLMLVVLAACGGRPEGPASAGPDPSTVRVVPVDTTYSTLPEPRTDSAYRLGNYLFYGDKELVFDFYPTGRPPARLRSKGDTLHCDSSYTILGDYRKVNGEVYVTYTVPYRFEDFPVRERFRGPYAAPDFRTDPAAREFRTRIRAACAKDTIHFAGRYTVAGWGCGMMCEQMALVDRGNGRVFFSPKYLPFDTADGHWGADYRRDSRLLIVNAYLLEEEPGYLLQS